MRVLHTSASPPSGLGELTAADGDAITCCDSADALAHALAAPRPPDVVVLDARRLGPATLPTLRRTRTALGAWPAWVLVLADPDGADRPVDLYEAGADDVACDPDDAHALRLRARLARRGVRARRELWELREGPAPDTAPTPTGQRFMAALATRLARAVDRREAVALMLLEADDIAMLHEGLGPQAAGRVIAALRTQVDRALGDRVLVGECGDTVAMLLAPCTAPAARGLAAQLHLMTSAMPVRFGPDTLQVYASIGLSCADTQVAAPTPEGLWSRGQSALEAAQVAGGDRIMEVRDPSLRAPLPQRQRRDRTG